MVLVAQYTYLNEVISKILNIENLVSGSFDTNKIINDVYIVDFYYTVIIIIIIMKINLNIFLENYSLNKKYKTEICTTQLLKLNNLYNHLIHKL